MISALGGVAVRALVLIVCVGIIRLRIGIAVVLLSAIAVVVSLCVLIGVRVICVAAIVRVCRALIVAAPRVIRIGAASRVGTFGTVLCQHDRLIGLRRSDALLRWSVGCANFRQGKEGW